MKALIAFALIISTAGCVSLQPQLRNVSVQADVSSQVSGDFDYEYAGINYHGGRVGRVAVILEQPVSGSITYRVGIEHRSLIDTTKDRGEERAIAGFTWRPFR